MAQPLFILSFRHRDELTRLAEAAGWQPIAARRETGAEARFLASGAAVALVDARGALDEGIAAVRVLGEAVEGNAGALLVLLSRNDEASLDRLHDLGATHFLVSPFSEAQLGHAIAFAARHAERVGGMRPVGAPARAAEGSGSSAGAGSGWRWTPGSRIVELSPMLARKAGFADTHGGAVPIARLMRRIDAPGRRAARDALARLLSAGEATAFAHADPDSPGGRIAHHVRRGPDGIVAGLAETFGDVDAPEAGSRDALTGLADTRALRNRLMCWMERGAAPDLLLVALTRFDAINLAFGRAAGDAVLQEAARRIERLVPGHDEDRLVARVAGAEFAIALRDGSGESRGGDGGVTAADRLAIALVEMLGRPYVSGGRVITVGSKAGIADARAGDGAAILLRRASIALAEAKAGDGAPVRRIDAAAEDQADRGEKLEIDLRRALDADQIEILFQPQVALADGRIVGVEALARWTHPLYGALGADTLFGVAERSDYLAVLSDHVQARAIAAVAAWPAVLADLRVAINVTAQDLMRPGFVDHMAARAAAAGLDPGRLTAEVVESGFIEDLSVAAARLNALRAAGFRVAIDDFGTGYSSLAYIQALPLDYLKLDKSLIGDLAASARDRVVVQAVIDMARSLGLDVVAEGVEQEDQRAILAEAGCTYYQGFLCAPPLGVAALAALVEGQGREAAE